MKYFNLATMIQILTLSCSTTILFGQAQIVVDSAKSPNGDGVDIRYAENNGIIVREVQQTGIQIIDGATGLIINDAANNGIFIGEVGDHGVLIGDAGFNGITIQSANVNAISIADAGWDGVNIHRSGVHGVDIDSAGTHGIHVTYADDDGIHITEAGSAGVQVDNAFYGVRVGNSMNDGIYIGQAGDDGIHIEGAAGDGVYVSDADRLSLYVLGSKSQNPASPFDHIAQIENEHAGGGADVLSLKVGQDDPGTASNFITFFDGNNDILGRIEGNGSGGVSFESNSADFAEYLAKESSAVVFSPGDVVGIRRGKISLNTTDAEHVMAVTDRPIVIGNSQVDLENFEKVSLLGQVPVKVTGMVKAGDWIVASGLNDGIAKAAEPSEITLEMQILGRALESNANPGIKLINTIVGLDKSEAKNVIIDSSFDRLERQEQHILTQQTAIETIRTEIAQLKKILKSQSLPNHFNEFKK